MKIVQISELHVGSQFLESKFYKMALEVNELNPDVVVITGDLTNDGILSEYERCSQLLSTITTKTI